MLAKREGCCNFEKSRPERKPLCDFTEAGNMRGLCAGSWVAFILPSGAVVMIHAPHSLPTYLESTGNQERKREHEHEHMVCKRASTIDSSV